MPREKGPTRERKPNQTPATADRESPVTDPITPSPQYPANSIDVKAEMAKLAKMNLHELRPKFRDLYGFPTTVAHKIYLQSRIIWKMQPILGNLDLDKEDWALVNVLSRNAPVPMRPKRKVEQGDGMEANSSDEDQGGECHLRSIALGGEHAGLAVE